MGYRLTRLDEPVLIAVPKPLLSEFGIHHKWRGVSPICGVAYAYDNILPRKQTEIDQPPWFAIIFMGGCVCNSSVCTNINPLLQGHQVTFRRPPWHLLLSSLFQRRDYFIAISVESSNNPQLEYISWLDKRPGID